MRKTLLTVLAATASLLAQTATAQEHLTFSAGSFDVLDENTPNFGLEYRGESFWRDLLPIAGVQVNTDGGLYGYVGLNYDWQFTDRWYLTPTLAVGAYDDNSSEDLGGWLEFRSGIEISHRFENAHRLGLAFHHISNASIYDENPGTEQVMLTYSVPVNLFK